MLEPDDRRHIRAEQATDLLADGREDHVGPHALRHQCRQSAQRRLLLGKPCESLARLGILDRGREQLGEVGQTRLGAWRQRVLLCGGGDHRAPEASRHDDRNSDRGANSGATDDLGDLAFQLRVLVDAGRLAVLTHELKDVRAFE